MNPVRPAHQPLLRLHFGYYRRRHPAPLAALITLSSLAAWCLLALESPSWRWVLAHKSQLYPRTPLPRLGAGDPLRLLLQSLWLLLIKPARRRPAGMGRALWRALQPGLRRLRSPIARPRAPLAIGPQRPVPAARWHLAALLLGVPILVLCVTQPLEADQQALFAGLLGLAALCLSRLPGRDVTLLLILLSILVSSRYFWWRYTATLRWEHPLDLACGLLLLLAESYSGLVLLLGYLQGLWPLDRPPCPLPADTADWPSVDLYIPTYNEDLSVVRATVLAATGLDWPRDKLNIWLLDDGRRDSFRRLARELGVGYLTRGDNRHAKAGNLNAALRVTDGEFIAIFDCDHIPACSFLQLTMGGFLRSPKLGLVQTPHHFLSADPFERNLANFRQTPNENTLFYGLIQNGNDLWDAAFFCGSCAVLRRSALESIGGFAVETLTEDAHTALRLHRQGWTSAYIRIPQAAGLATESLSGHIVQRIRWARGMVQILCLDNPLFGKGLSLGQRLCYSNAMLHFLYGVPRLIYLTAPLAFLLLHAYIIDAPTLLILLFVLPHIAHSALTNSRIQGRYRHSFWSDLYETVLCWYIARATCATLVDPRKGSFNVTAKGGLIEAERFDWTMARPFLVLAALNLAGLLAGLLRLVAGPADERLTVLISLCWVLYNLVMLGGSLAVAAEVRQIRRSHRVAVRLPAAIRLPGGQAFACTLRNFSATGVGLELPSGLALPSATHLALLLKRGQDSFEFPLRVLARQGRLIGAALEPLDPRAQADFVQCTHARADTWARWHEGFAPDQPLRSLLALARIGLGGYRRALEHGPRPLQRLVEHSALATRWLASFMPVTPQFSLRQPDQPL